MKEKKHFKEQTFIEIKTTWHWSVTYLYLSLSGGTFASININTGKSNKQTKKKTKQKKTKKQKTKTNKQTNKQTKKHKKTKVNVVPGLNSRSGASKPTTELNTYKILENLQDIIKN